MKIHVKEKFWVTIPFHCALCILIFSIKCMCNVKAKFAPLCLTICDPHILYQLSQEYWKVGSLVLLQGIFPSQESNLGLLYCRQILYQLSYQGSPCALFFRPVWLFVTLWTVAWWAPLSIGLSRQEYWSGLPCLPPGILLTQGSNPCVSCFLLHLASLHLLNLKTLHSKV